MSEHIIVNKSEYEKLQEQNKKLRNEIARLSNQTQVDYRGAYEESHEQLNTAKKALTEIINANENLFLNVDGRGDLNKALDKARQALAAIGVDDDENRL